MLGTVEIVVFPRDYEKYQRLVEQERYGRDRRPAPRIVKAQLGNDAGIVGAALLGMK